ncbi:MAG: hypothetical protein DLM64_13465 [Solirubrobacterales bacterium]|nr:MAG: hypothetical protein DLM64_13465 [Solirubrobacterales bacterium]
MPSPLVNRAIGAAAHRIPGLSRLPVMRLLALGEVVLLAREHVVKLEPGERRRLVELVRRGRGRPRNLSSEERTELSRLIAKTDPRLFAGLVADKLSPVRLPRRVVRGPRRR